MKPWLWVCLVSVLVLEGVSELLSGEDIVPPKDVCGLSKLILEVITDRDRMNKMARRNYAKSLEYTANLLDKRREEFYQKLKHHFLSLITLR